MARRKARFVSLLHTHVEGISSPVQQCQWSLSSCAPILQRFDRKPIFLGSKNIGTVVALALDLM